MSDALPPPPPAGWGATPKAGPIHVVGDAVKLAEEQQVARLRILEDDYEVMALTGRAGAGKSTLANYLMQKDRLTCCATTGKASVVNQSFWTVDALFGFNREDWKVNMSRAEKSLGRRNVSETILVDEGSMVGVKMLTAMLEAARKFRKRIVLVGDWAQAKPVKDEWIVKHPDFDKRNVIRLMDCHRQTDRDFLDALNDIRMGIPSDLATKVFKGRTVATCPDAPGIIRMVATNREADSINGKHLGALIRSASAFPVTLMCSAKDVRDEDTSRKWPLENWFYAAKIDDSGFANRDEVAIGAQIMFVSNARVTNYNNMEADDFVPERAYVNGDVGIIEDIWYSPQDAEALEFRGAGLTTDADGRITLTQPSVDYDAEPLSLANKPPMFLLQSKHIRAFSIRLTRTDERIRVSRHKTEFMDQKGLPKLSVLGWPFRLGWASTIHKAQGTTVDKAWLDLESIRAMKPDGRHGLAYVGLSRTRTLEGLYLGSWDPSVIACDPIVKDLI